MSIEWQVSQAKEFSQLVERAKKEKDQFLKNNNLEKISKLINIVEVPILKKSEQS
jgi:hypothetical protein